MFTNTSPAPVIPPSPPTEPRLVLGEERSRRATLDGGWWPRSTDTLAELPGLLLALDDRYGPIRNVLLNNAVWEGRFRRMALGARVVRVGWFVSLDPAQVVLTTEGGEQIDLLVVPPDTDEATAGAAMARAADPTDGTHAPDLLRTPAAAMSY
jgi:hypothetical protein